jgi:hypothetical protein
VHETVLIRPGSVHADLCELSAWLCETYHWPAEASILIVLTGRAPRIVPLRVEAVHDQLPHKCRPRHLMSELVLTATSWLSAETQEKALRVSRRGVVGTTPGFCERNLALVQFIEEQRDPDGALPPWPNWLRRWNDAHVTCTKWLYAGYNRMCRDYGRTRRALLYATPEMQGRLTQTRAADPKKPWW